MRRWIPVAGLLAAGCGDKFDTGSTGDTASDEPFAPEEGSWDASALQTLEDGCNISSDKTRSYTINIEMLDESTMSVSGVELDLTCTLTEMSYSCDDEVDVQDYTSKGADVVLTTTFSYSGAFSDAQTGGLLYTIVADSEGADCGQLEKDQGLPLPCTTAASTELTFSD